MADRSDDGEFLTIHPPYDDLTLEEIPKVFRALGPSLRPFLIIPFCDRFMVGESYPSLIPTVMTEQELLETFRAQRLITARFRHVEPPFVWERQALRKKPSLDDFEL